MTDEYECVKCGLKNLVYKIKCELCGHFDISSCVYQCDKWLVILRDFTHDVTTLSTTEPDEKSQ